MQIDMKYNIRLICLFAVLGSLLSCNRWLDITPEDTITEKQLFQDAGGYHSAINGLYQSMSSASLYGENLTWGFLSALSQNYDNASNNNSMRFSHTEKYEYGSDEVKAFGEDIWQAAFNVIANSNNILKHLESADMSIFPLYEKGEVDMIAGEAIAIRALLHFDLLRLFSVSPAVDMDAKAIPYVETFPEYFSERLTNRQVLDKIITDLHKSGELLAKYDTTTTGLLMMSSTGNRLRMDNSNGGLFFNSRGTRLNYFSVLALLSRVYLYQGNNEKAFEYAKKIEKYIRNADNWFFYTKRGFSAQDSEEFRPHKLIDELLVAFYEDELTNKYIAKAVSSDSPYKLKNLSWVFKDADDYRYVKLVHTITPEVKISLKYLRRSEAGSDIIKIENRLIPIMRISEIHLILAECLAKKGNIPEAVAYLKKLRTARGCIANALDSSMSENDFYAALDAEIIRENIAEGQYFFYCKRINAATINNGGVYVPMEGKYTLEIPNSQTTF